MVDFGLTLLGESSSRLAQCCSQSSDLRGNGVLRLMLGVELAWPDLEATGLSAV